MRIIKSIFEKATEKRTVIVSHGEPPAASDSELTVTKLSKSAILTKQLAKLMELDEDFRTTEQLTILMLMVERTDLIRSPRLWIKESKVLRLITDAALDSLGSPTTSDDEKGDTDVAMRDQRVKAGMSKALNKHSFQLRIWAKVYYLLIPKDGHATPKQKIATQIRQLLIDDGYKLPANGADAGNDEVPSVDTITRRWLANV